MKVHLLGPVRVVTQTGDLVTPASAAQRRLVALMGLHAHRVVPADAICAALDLTAGAARTTISRVRRLVGAAVLATEPPGYALRADTDIERFEQLIGSARSASSDEAIALRTEALDLFAWEALPEFANEEWAIGAVTRLNELRADTVEELAAGLIDSERRVDAIALLERQIPAYPYRSRPRELLMTALALDGRPSEALRAFQVYRRFMIEGSGLEPPASARAVEVEVATGRLGPQAPNRAATTSTVPRAALPAGIVTFLLTDIESSTEAWELDSAAMTVAVEHHYRIIDDLVERHGGVRPQEQGEGDSTVSVFVDAGCAALAALDIQLAFEQHGWTTNTPIRLKIALHTGDAQLRNDSNYAGLSVIRAARLRSVAHGGQILVSAAAHAVLAPLLPAPVALRDLGRHHFKGLDGAQHVFQLEHPGLRVDFPPSNALESTPNNLPIHPTSFVGRVEELQTLAGLLADHRIVTVTGSGGAGKTRLACRAARDQLDRFPDGVWWIELAPVADSTGVSRAVADALDVRVSDDETIAVAVARRLGDDVCLLVLDNAEHVTAGVGALSADILQRCPNTVVLVTSRRVLGIAGELPWRLPSLSLPGSSTIDEDARRSDAMALFAERAQSAGAPLSASAEELPVVAEICRRLDGVPLAIELAAARTRVLAPRQILDGLSDALSLLTRGGPSSPPRHRTLDASIGWSISLLDDDERSFLARLSVFAGSFDLAAVIAVCGADGPDAPTTALDVIETLVDHSLVAPAGGIEVRRLALLEVVRQYGARLLEAGGETALTRSRHARHYIELARQVGPLTETAEELAAVSRLEADAGNIDAALAWVRDHGDEDDLVGFVGDLAPHWNMVSATRDSEHWLTLALQTSPDAPAATRARLLTYRGLARSNVGDYPGSLDDCVAALELAATVPDPWSIGRARWIIADMATWGNLESWRSLHDEAIAALAQSGDAFAEAYAWMWRAMPYLMRGHLTIGVDALRAAHAKVAQLDNPTVNSSLLAWQAWARFHGGELQGTEDLTRLALSGPGFRLASQRFFVELLAISAALRRGVAHPLRVQFERNVALAHRQGEILAAASSRQYMVEWLLFSDPSAAVDAAIRLLADLPAGYKVGVCGINLTAAWACVAMDDAAAAQGHAVAAANAGSVAAWPINRTRMLAVQAMIAMQRANVGEAARLADDAAGLALEHGLQLSLVDALDVRAVVAASCDDLGLAAETLGAVDALRAKLGAADVFLPTATATATARQRATTGLGKDAFAERYTRGGTLTPHDLIASRAGEHAPAG